MEDSIYKQIGRERKALQESGGVPEWITTPAYQMLKSKYLSEGETLRQRYESVARCAAAKLDLDTEQQEQWSEKFFHLMWSGWLALSTPVLANMGSFPVKGCPVSCAGSYIGDSVYDFYNNRLEGALLSQYGFGTSGYLGDIRERGASISRGGKADGVVPVFKGHLRMARDISQGSARRGSWAGYLPIEHGDFWELGDFTLNNPDDCNIGWNISDNFVQRLNSGDTEALSRFQRAMKIKMVTGKGYFFFPDKANALNPPMYAAHNLSVKASNLCVSGDTKILTSGGHVEIQSLEDQEVEIWNGEAFSKTVVRKTGENQELLLVQTNSGQEVKCTPYHKFYVQREYHAKPVEVRAKDLQPGDKLIKFDLPIIQGDEVFDQAYTNGFYSGDGCSYQGQQIIYLYGEKRELLDKITGVTRMNHQPSQARTVLYGSGLEEKFTVPDSTYTVQSRLEWLAGLCDADGTVARNGTNESVQICSTRKDFLQKVQLMLQTLGVTSKVTKFRDARMIPLPANDGTGESKEYFCNEVYRLLISSTGLYELTRLGFSCHRLQWEKRKPQRCAEQFIKVASVEPLPVREDTFCFTEPLRNMGMFNGILAGNCSEITLHSDEDHTFTCVLSSMNLSKYDEWKDTDAVFTATVFLDCVAEEFIRLGRNIRGLERAVRFTEKSRALGLGALGWHTYLQSKGIAFESFEAHSLNGNIFKAISEEANRASKWMAEEFGEPEWCRGFGVRNTHLMAVAPNLSSALICGSVSQGIEPMYMNVFVQDSAGGEIDRVNPVLIPIMKGRKVFNSETIMDIAKHKGSVQHVDWLDEEEKKVFKTAFEIDQYAIIRQAAARQRYIDQGQSINLFFAADEREEVISAVHQEAFNNPWIKGLYYIRSEAGVRGSTGECEACEG